MSNVELVNDTVENLDARDPDIVARGVIQVDGRNEGQWEVRSESRWSAFLEVTAKSLQASSKDELKGKIARALTAGGSGRSDAEK